MKKLLLILAGFTLAAALLVSCDPPVETTVQTPEPTDSAPPVSASPEPSPSISATPEPTAPADVSPTPEPSALTLMTFDEAREICATWLDNHADVPSEYFDEWVVDPYEIPPPTYHLFDVPYYVFPLSNSREGTSWFSRKILVQAETGELLSLYQTRTDEKHLTATVELLDDWYAGKYPTLAPVHLTTEEAIAIYDAWRDEHSDDSGSSAGYSLDEQSNSTYILFEEQYYLFDAKDDWAYWYNILVNMETGELLFMMIEDGMFGGTTIVLLDDWYASIPVQ